MASLLDLEHLIPQYDENDPQLGELVARSVYTPIFQLVAIVYPVPARAGEMTTTILHAVLEQLPRYLRGTSFSVWLFTVANRHLQTEYRRAILQQILHFQRPVIPDPSSSLISVLSHHFQMEVAEIASIVGQRESTILQKLEKGPPPVQLAPWPGETEIEQAIIRLRPYFVRQRKPARFEFGKLLQTGGEYMRIGTILVGVLIILLFVNNNSPEGGRTLFPTATPPLPPVVQISPSDNLISATSPTVQANLPPLNSDPTISADGRFIVFVSDRQGLVPNDTNQSLDIFVYEIATGSVERVSITSDGKQLNGDSDSPDISADGRYVVFASNATNLVEGVSNQCGTGQTFHFCTHVYFHDRVTGKTELVSRESDGSVIDANSYLPTISGDGWTVAFWAVTGICEETAFLGQCSNVFVHDRRSGETIEHPAHASNLNERTIRLDLSTDGNRLLYPYFQIVQTNSSTTIFETWKIFDRGTNAVQPVFRNSSPNQGILIPRLSGDGQSVAFVSIYDGFFLGDTNLSTDVFVTNLTQNTLHWISKTPDGEQANNNSGAERLPGWNDGIGFSNNGRYVVFLSTANNLITDRQSTWCAQLTPVVFWDCYGLYLYDRETGQTQQISLPVFPLVHYLYPSISDDGRFLSLQGYSPNPSENCPTGGCSAIFALDRQSEEILLVSGPFDAESVQDDQWNFYRNIPGHDNQVNSVAFSLDGQWVASGGQDGKIILTNLENDTLSQVSPHTFGGVSELAILPDKENSDGAFWVIAGTMDRNLIVWNPITSAYGASKFDTAIHALAVSVDENLVAIGTSQEIRIQNFYGGLWEEVITFPHSNVNALAFSPEGEYIAIADGEEVWLRRVSDGKVITRMGGHTERVLDVAFSPNKTYLASSSEDGNVLLWRLKNQHGELIPEYAGMLKHNAWVYALAFSPNSDQLVTGTFDSSLQLWDIVKIIPLQTIRRTNQDQVLSLAFSPDGTMLAAGTVRGGRLWKLGPPDIANRANTNFYAFQPNDTLLDKSQLSSGVTALNPKPNVLFSLDEAQKLVTFDILAPTLSKEKFTLSGIGVVTNPTTGFEGITIAYLHTTNYQPALLLITQSNTNPASFDTRIAPSAQIQEITIHNTLAELVSGNWLNNERDFVNADNSTLPSSITWDEESASYWLRWHEDGTYIAIYYDTTFNRESIRENELFTLEDLLEIAGSLR